MASSFINVNELPLAADDLASLLLYAERISLWNAGKPFTDYQPDLMLKDATERNFIEIGNIIHRFEKTAPHFYQQLTKAEEWYAFRIKLDHIRWKIDDAIVWDTIHTDLPTLIQEAKVLIQTTAASPAS